MALVWGAICSDCQALAVENCPHCLQDYCEKHCAQHTCEDLKSREYAIPG